MVFVLNKGFYIKNRSPESVENTSFIQNQSPFGGVSCDALLSPLNRQKVVPWDSDFAPSILFFSLRGYFVVPEPQKNQKGVPQNAADFGSAASITWDSGVRLASEQDKGLLP